MQSEFLNSKRNDCKELVCELSKHFGYVSILGSHITSAAIAADKRRSVMGEGNLSECGFVIRMHDGRAFYEYSLDDISGVEFKEGVQPFDGTPVFLKAELEISECCDTFIKLPTFKKGIIIVNNKVLSRHWEVGPQRSAYIPAPFLREGKNEIVVFELEGYETPAFVLDDEPNLG